MISHFELESLLRRVENGTTTVRDAETLRRLLRGVIATDTVAPSIPPR